MISSMTGYGRGEATVKGISVVVEIRTVNSRFLEVGTKLPRSISSRENDIKELLRKKINRGKVTLTVQVEFANVGDAVPLRVNKEAAKAYMKLLNDLRKAAKLTEKVKLEHLLKFSDIMEPLEAADEDDAEWRCVEKGINLAVDNLAEMRRKEGGELRNDLEQRLRAIERLLEENERLSKNNVVNEQKRLRDRVNELLEDKSVIDNNRLELEIALLSDKLDVTEECVRFRSHIKFFLESLDHEEAAGRKLNFLLQEMNREANTIGSKSFESSIAHNVVTMKEELERIREQLQNIE